jgi:hypothetical protein
MRLVGGCRTALHADHAQRQTQVPYRHWHLPAVASFHGGQSAQAQLEQPDCMPWARSWVAAHWEVVMSVRAPSVGQGMTVLC